MPPNNPDPTPKKRTRRSAESRFTKAARAETELNKLRERVAASQKRHAEAAKELSDYTDSLPPEVRELLGLSPRDGEGSS